MYSRPANWNVLFLAILVIAASRSLMAQTATVRGRVFDPAGAVVPHATITLTDRAGSTTTVNSGSDGSFLLTAVAPGQYSVKASAPSLEQVTPLHVSLKPGPQFIRIELRIAAIRQETTVQDA